MAPPAKRPTLRRGHGAQTQALALRDETEELVIPPCPKGLLPRTRKRWDAYWTSDVARAADPVIDLHLVERWIRAVDQYERLEPIVKKTPLIKGSVGQLRINPLAAHLESLVAQIRQAEDALGMSPKARAQLGIALYEAQAAAKRARFQGPSTANPDDPPEIDPRLVLIQ